MTFSVRLHSIMCIEESDESSASDEPYVLVTSARLGPLPSVPVTFRYGEWKNFDDSEILDLIGERPFWGILDEPWEPEDIANPDDVCFVVTIMEHDEGNIDAVRGVVETAATTSLASTLALPRATRVVRLLNAIRSAIGLLNLPTLDDHVGTQELRLDASDLAIPPGSSKDKKLLIDGGDEGRWELVFRVVHHERKVFLPNSRLAAVSRTWDRMELWAVGQNGVLHGNWFHGRWHGWYGLPGPTFGPGTHLAAVTRNPDHMEVWAVGLDGIVRGVWFSGSKWEGWYELPGATFMPGSPLAAVSRHPDLMEIWGVDVDGIIRGKFFDKGWKPENGWYSLGGAEFPQGVHLAAVSHSPWHMQVWVVGDDRPILGNRFDGTQWQGWESLDGEIYAPGAEIAAVVEEQESHLSADPLQLAEAETPDMYVLSIDMNDHVRNFWFEKDSNRGWYQAGTEFFHQGIAAISRAPASTDALAPRQNGVMHHNRNVGPGWTGWVPLDGLQFTPPTFPAALSRMEGHAEVWACSQGWIWGNSLVNDTWQGWYPLRWSFVA